MKRRTHLAIVLALAAGLALLTGGSEPGAASMAEAGSAQGGHAATTDVTLTAETLRGAAVYGPDGGRIGDVEDVVIDPGGIVEGAIVVSGGVLGIGARRVAVPLERLSIEQGREGGAVRIVTRLSASDIAALPEYP